MVLPKTITEEISAFEAAESLLVVPGNAAAATKAEAATEAALSMVLTHPRG